jgi:hydroxymethylpyrimidine/phosphomethylpyrimidine kinase
MNKNKPILTITGSDSTGGSGVQADIRMISALGCFAVSAITSITVQKHIRHTGNSSIYLRILF